MYESRPILPGELEEEQQRQREKNLWEDGTYRFKVEAYIDKISKAKYPMMELKLVLIGENNKTKIEKEWLVFPPEPVL